MKGTDQVLAVFLVFTLLLEVNFEQLIAFVDVKEGILVLIDGELGDV